MTKTDFARAGAMAPLLLAAALAGPHAAKADPALDVAGARLLEIDRFVGQIEIRTAPGARFSVELIPGRAWNGNVRRDGVAIRVAGDGERLRMTRCEGGARDGVPSLARVTLDGRTFAAADLPRLVVTGPDTMGLRIKRSILAGRVGDVGGATVEAVGCGDLEIGDVARDLELSAAGSGDVSVGRVGGALTANLAGSGGVRAGAVGGRTRINLAGSGDVAVASVGATEVNLAGSGDVLLGGGSGRLEVNIAGAGDVRHDGEAVEPEIAIIGSGDVSVARVRGAPSVSRMGTGRFAVDGR
jgi:hypothetical protein